MEKIERVKANTPIAILMATYNGASYLCEQIDSLLAQTMADWTLFINDDGSTDSTPDIIRRYAAQHHNIVVMRLGTGLGACENFLRMLHTIDARYYFFCDQDDHWSAYKIEREMKAMADAERLNPRKPIIVHSDLSVVDQQMRLIHPSFIQYAGVYPNLLNQFDHSVEPYVTGCTMMLNRAARDSVSYPTSAAVMHDAWATLCTLRANGITVLVDEPLVDYRQHVSNTLGARDIQKVNMTYRLKRFRSILRERRRHYAMLRTLGFGSPVKYIYQKIRFKCQVNKIRNRQRR